MPLTFSHPAAVLPLKRLCPRYLNFFALLLGSLLPDLGYFLFLFPEATFAHSLPGVLILDLPAGLVLWGIGYGLVKRRLFWKGDEGIAAVWKVSASLCVGALSHVVWDGFTHQRGVFGQIPLLNAPTLTFGGAAIPLYKLLQHGSTLAGLIALAAYSGKEGIRNVLNAVGWNRGRLLGASLIALLLAGILTRHIHAVEPKLFYMTLYFTDALAVQWIAFAVRKNVRQSGCAPAPLRSS